MVSHAAFCLGDSGALYNMLAMILPLPAAEPRKQYGS